MNFRHPLILASSSPRRQFLLQQAGFRFTVASPDIDESFPASLPVQHIPVYLAEKKASVFAHQIADAVVLASDTVVILGQDVLNKPADRNEAIDMLTRLAGRTHLVITAVCLLGQGKTDTFEDHTRVTFRPVSRADIEFYVDHFKPFDKAGSYGAQDCLPEGFNPCSAEEVAFLSHLGKMDLINESIRRIPAGKSVTLIDHIDGAYFTVMGLPLHKVYAHLMAF